MNDWESLPLRSYELAKYSVPVECYVCDGDNRFDADFCRHCRAPLTLAFENHKKDPPSMVAILGGPGVGKTCYLGMLTNMLARQQSGLQMLAQGACSLALQQKTTDALANRNFPPPTAESAEEWQWIHGEVRSTKHRRSVNLVLPDLAGAAIIKGIDAPRKVPAIPRMLAKSVGAMILCDVHRQESSRDDAEAVAVKIAESLLNIQAPKRKGWAHRPVVFILTKGDQDDQAFDHPSIYVQQHMPQLWRISREFHHHQFFATSIAVVHTGLDGYGDWIPIPMRIEPRSVVEPFEWLTHQLAA